MSVGWDVVIGGCLKMERWRRELAGLLWRPGGNGVCFFIYFWVGSICKNGIRNADGISYICAYTLQFHSNQHQVHPILHRFVSIIKLFALYPLIISIGIRRLWKGYRLRFITTGTHLSPKNWRDATSCFYSCAQQFIDIFHANEETAIRRLKENFAEEQKRFVRQSR